MGAPDTAQREWIADTVQFAKEHQIDRGDLGRELLLSVAAEIGVWKVLAILALFLVATVGGTIFGVVKFFQRGKGS